VSFILNFIYKTGIVIVYLRFWGGINEIIWRRTLNFLCKNMSVNSNYSYFYVKLDLECVTVLMGPTETNTYSTNPVTYHSKPRKHFQWLFY
jgi:ABC-type uncharacterized transport system permease subunit